MSKTKQKKSENDYKCCKLEIYKLTPSFRNSRLSSSERLCWIVWSITRSFTLIYPYPCFFSFWNTYFVINEEKSQISYITMYGISHHQNDTQTQSLCKSLLLFFVFVCLFVFSILTNLYINFETGKLLAHERNNFIFHVNMHFCNIVLFHKCRFWVLATQRIILYKSCAILSSNEQTC
jgi:hypothetical protein